VHLAYSIGSARPISVWVNTFDTGAAPDEDIKDRLLRLIDFRPGAIENRFALRSRAARAGAPGLLRRLAVYGQVGRIDLDLPWERTDVAEALAAG
jgi:S-adenosylmethionine synthetase